MRRPQVGPSEPSAAAVRPSATASDPAPTASPAIGLDLGLGALALGGLVAVVLLGRRRGGDGAARATAPSAPPAPDPVELELQEMLAEAAARRSAQAAAEPTERGTVGPH
jgi:hypothetical protein